MAVIGAETVITSDMPDIRDLPLDSNVTIDAEEYASIRRRISVQDGASHTPVSAFNSSI
jgi:hypothetical protein